MWLFFFLIIHRSHPRRTQSIATCSPSQCCCWAGAIDSSRGRRVASYTSPAIAWSGKWVISLSLICKLCRHLIDLRKTWWCWHKKYFTTYIDMLFQSNGMLKYLRNNGIMSNFSSDTTIVVFRQPSFILWSQCALHFRYFRVVVYPGPFFVLWILMNQSFQSHHPEVGMVSLLYDSVMEQRTVFVQNFK